MTGLNQKSLNRIEDAQWLLAAGEHPTRVARRVGTSVAALTRLLQRAGQSHPAMTTEYQRSLRHARREVAS